MVTALTGVALFAPLITPYNPSDIDLDARHNPPHYGDHPLGTDRLGRDVLTRVAYGLRVSLLAGFVAATLAGTVGTVLGSGAGYAGGIAQSVIMRLVDVQMSFPFMLLAIMWVSIFGSGALNIVLIIAILGWVPYARVTHGLVLSLKHLSYIEAAKALGASTTRILGRHLLPQLLPSVLVIATFQVGWAILLEATLGYLGLGVPPPTPTLGAMLSEGQSYLSTAWWEVGIPALVLMLLVLGINSLGDGLRDVLDPKMRGTS